MIGAAIEGPDVGSVGDQGVLRVLFVNENELGHRSYLLPFVERISKMPELGLVCDVLDATPIPGALGRIGNASVPVLRRWGLDFHPTRWRLAVSRYVEREVERRVRRGEVDVVVANTQSVALRLAGLARSIPVLVALDATFEELRRTPWFCPSAAARLAAPMSLAPLLRGERALFRGAAHLLPWSEPARRSLVEEYGVPEAAITLLPPSLPPRARPEGARPKARPQILFLGGDFRRKGGPLLLECFRAHFRERCELHIVTQSPVEAEPGVHVHRGVRAYTPEWLARWSEADVFVFPSEMETFGIVLLEALSFRVPVISADVGAARDVLGEHGEAGLILAQRTVRELADAIDITLSEPEAANNRASRGYLRLLERYDVDANARTLARLVRRAGGDRRRGTGILRSSGRSA